MSEGKLTKAHSDPAILRSLADTLRGLGYQVEVTTSANTPWLLDGQPMSTEQFHGTAHHTVYPRTALREANGHD